MRSRLPVLIALLMFVPLAQGQAPDMIHTGMTGTMDGSSLQPMDATHIAIHWSVPTPYPPTQTPIARVSIDGGEPMVIPASLAGTPRDYTPVSMTDEHEVLPVYVAIFAAPLGSRITYQVGQGSSLSEERTVKALPRPTDAVRIVAGSYWGYEGYDRLGNRIADAEAPQVQTVEQMLTLDPDLFLMVGNMGLSSSNKPWNGFMRATEPIQSTVITMGAIASADASDNAMQFRERYALPHIEPLAYKVPGSDASVGNREEVPNELMYYGFSAGPAYLIALDTTALCKPQTVAPVAAPTPPPVPPCPVGQPDPEQINWLHDTLEDLREDYLVPWIIVYLNNGPYAFADDGDDLAVQQYLQPLFDTFNVDLVLHSNERIYQRSYPVRYGSIYKDNASLMPAGQGPVYVMVGSASGDPTKLIPGPWPAWMAQAGGLHGFVDVQATPTTLKVTARGTDGSVFDAFTIDKNLEANENAIITPPPRMPFLEPFAVLAAVGLAVMFARIRGGKA
jgi:hypothetical protein